jgi:hypothetical protein
MDELLGYVSQLIDYIERNGSSLNATTQQELAVFLQEVMGFINEYNQQKSQVQAPAPQGTDLLWILAGGKPDAFVEYLRTFPDTNFQQLLANPSQLQQVIAELTQRFPEGINLEADGIPHAPLMSSNIYGFQYDSQRGELLVRFNNGGVYAYEGVPPGVFNIFQKGAVPAKTDGKNQFGEWWQGKIPSLGAAFYELIRNGGYPYQRLK